ncbi:MAG: hypothetical protein E6J60_11585 [Deltaproteobacteria bacterium]|nr:MAG: hypothetical protein E6J60_11585 [Deltaproteobacteria bacterium]
MAQVTIRPLKNGPYQVSGKPPLASVAVDGTDPGELRFVRGVDAPELAEARGRRAGGESTGR